ncbi:MAG TPA: TetR/AcrR family transcriptional regulator [Streptosporangiaceae bacterium]|jgi:TetR/AcrR family transcriptional repressor of mexJK operon|nr:TetR/AcrR family transcriptional regulator [Streptosporangiaceae bacterium]
MVHAAPAGTLGTGEQPPGGRSARKRQAIIEAATTLFLEQGYQGTSMDDIAAMAAVSKQTVYKNFADKQQLFSDIVLGAAARADEFIAALPRMLADTDDLEAGLKALARRYLATVMQPRLLQMRRLIVAESGRFPDLARAYYERVPEHVMTALAVQFGELAGRGLLRIDDPAVAAGHYAFLVLGLALDRAMFLGPGHGMSAAELDRQADEAARAFLAAYGPP